MDGPERLNRPSRRRAHVCAGGRWRDEGGDTSSIRVKARAPMPDDAKIAKCEKADDRSANGKPSQTPIAPSTTARRSGRGASVKPSAISAVCSSRDQRGCETRHGFMPEESHDAGDSPQREH